MYLPKDPWIQVSFEVRFGLANMHDCRNCFGVATKAHSDQEEPTSRGINQAEVRLEDGDLVSFDTDCSDGGVACVLMLLASMNVSKAVLMLPLATRLASKEETALALMLRSQLLSLIEEASVSLLLLVEETAMVLFA
jgi:hypothetical protein